MIKGRIHSFLLLLQYLHLNSQLRLKVSKAHLACETNTSPMTSEWILSQA